MTGLEHFFLNKDRKTRKRLAWFFIVPVLGFTVGLLYCVWDAARVWRWQPASCTILFSDVEDSQAAVTDEPYQFHVGYEYLWGGSRHEGHVYARDWGSTETKSSDAAEMYKLARTYPTAARAVCFVNPNNAAEAVLARGIPTGVIVAAIAVFVIGMGFSLFYIEFGHDSPPLQRTRGDKLARGALLLGALIAYVWLAAWPLASSLRTLAWRPEPCRVLRSRVLEEEHSDQHGKFWLFRTDILYEYRVAGVSYRSNRLSYLDGQSVFQSPRRRAVSDYPRGLQTSCYVNPARPEQAVLQRAIKPAMERAVVPIAVALIALAGAIRPLRRVLRIKHPGAWGTGAAVIALAWMAVGPTIDFFQATGRDGGVQDAIFLIVLWVALFGCLIATTRLSANRASAI